MIHELKIKPEYFAAVVSGDKTFEIRNNADRNFQVGDTLLLWEWNGGFTGQTAERTVSYITDFEQKPGYVVLGLVNKREQELAEQLADATRQCGVMADLLREVTEIVPAIGVAIDDLPVVDAFLERIENALAGQELWHYSNDTLAMMMDELHDICVGLDAPGGAQNGAEAWDLVKGARDRVMASLNQGRPDTEWTDATTSPVVSDYRELQGQHDQLQSKHKVALDLLQESHEVMRRIIPPLPQDCAKRGDLLDRIEVALAGKLPEQHSDDAAVDRFAAAMKVKLAAARAKGRGGWDDPAACSVEYLADLLVDHVGKGSCGTFEDVANFAMMLHQRGADPAVLAHSATMTTCSRCKGHGMIGGVTGQTPENMDFWEAECPDCGGRGKVMVKARAITEGQELELVTVLQSIVNGFSDDPAHDAAALLKRITGEVPWTGDSFQLPPHQGGEPCATEPQSSSLD